jgi:hypothetical protein
MAAVAIGAAPASAQPVVSGVGGTQTKTSVLSFQLGQNGSLLNLALLTDIGGANIDPHGGTQAASASLIPITLSSPALHLNLSTPPISVLSPGGSGSAVSAPLTLTSLGVPTALATANLKPADLHSQFASTAAHSQMSAAEIDNVTLVGGALANIDLLASTLGADAVTSQADGARAVNIGTVNLLDLGALLKGIGLDLSTLPLGALSGLLGALHLPIAGLTSGTSLSDTVTQLSNVITNLRQTLVGATTTITSTVDNLTQSLLGKLGLPIPTVGSLVTTVNNLIASVQNTVVGLLSSVLKTLDSFPLVSLSGLLVGITTKATSTLAGSAAQVGMSPLSLTVAGVKLPLIDPTAIVSTINGVLATANGVLNGLLSTLGLPTDLLSLSLLSKATNVSQSAGYTTATAGLNVLNLKIASLDPTVILSAVSKLTGPLVNSLLGATPLAGLLGSTDAMGVLNGLLGQTASLLNGAQLQIASLAGSSTYVAAAAPAVVAPTPSSSLPLTGGNPELALLGVMLVIGTLGALRWRRVVRVRAAEVKID